MKTIIRSLILCSVCWFLFTPAFAQDGHSLPANGSFLTGNWRTNKDQVHTSSGKIKNGTDYRYNFKDNNIGYIYWTGTSASGYGDGEIYKFKWTYSKSDSTLSVELTKKLTEVWHLVSVTNNAIDMVLYQEGSTSQVKEERWLEKK